MSNDPPVTSGSRKQKGRVRGCTRRGPIKENQTVQTQSTTLHAQEQENFALTVNAALALDSLRALLERPELQLSAAEREDAERAAWGLAVSLGEVDPVGESFGIWNEDEAFAEGRCF
jgi:hypothetical protein